MYRRKLYFNTLQLLYYKRCFTIYILHHTSLHHTSLHYTILESTALNSLRKIKTPNSPKGDFLSWILNSTITGLLRVGSTLHYTILKPYNVYYCIAVNCFSLKSNFDIPCSIFDIQKLYNVYCSVVNCFYFSIPYSIISIGYSKSV